MSTFSVDLPDGARLTAAQAGEGETLLMVSGLGGTAGFWQPVTSQLPDWHCVSFDQRGVASSTRGQAAVTIAQLAMDAWAVLDALHVPTAHLVGHSTGGCIVQEMALIQPERVSSVVLGGTWAGPNVYMQQLFGMRSTLLCESPSLYDQTGAFLSYPATWLLEHPELMIRKTECWPQERVQVVAERIDALLSFDRRASLENLKAPALVLGALDDQIVPSFLQCELKDLLPNAKLHQWNCGGHFFPVVQSAAYAQALSEWFLTHSL